jgi:hypothetical protein
MWIATPGSASLIRVFDPEVAALFFDRGGSIVLNGGWEGATPGLSWASVDGFVADLEAERIPPRIEVVMYDPERWPATPHDEQRNPTLAMRVFAAVARAHGYERVVLTPHPNLMEVRGAVCGAFPGERIHEAFLRCGIPRVAAEVGDIVEIQAQYLQHDEERYAAFVAEAAAQARAENEDVMVLAGLSTRFSNSARDLLQAWDAVAEHVDGHYLAVPGVRPFLAGRFLSLLAERRG